MGRGPKAFIQVAGETLLARAVARLRQAGAEPIVVVLPPGPDPTQLPEDVIVVRNPSWESGPVGSAHLAISALPTGTRAALLYPVDHHAVSERDLSRVLAGGEEAPAGAAWVVPRFDGAGGHPVLLLRPALDALRGLESPASTTLKAVLQAAGAPHPVTGVGIGVTQNLNTPTDWPPDG